LLGFVRLLTAILRKLGVRTREEAATQAKRLAQGRSGRGERARPAELSAAIFT
jgi:hypothetical protein